MSRSLTNLGGSRDLRITDESFESLDFLGGDKVDFRILVFGPDEKIWEEKIPLGGISGTLSEGAGLFRLFESLVVPKRKKLE